MSSGHSQYAFYPPQYPYGMFATHSGTVSNNFSFAPGQSTEIYTHGSPLANELNHNGFQSVKAGSHAQTSSLANALFESDGLNEQMIETSRGLSQFAVDSDIQCQPLQAQFEEKYPFQVRDDNRHLDAYSKEHDANEVLPTTPGTNELLRLSVPPLSRALTRSPSLVQTPVDPYVGLNGMDASQAFSSGAFSAVYEYGQLKLPFDPSTVGRTGSFTDGAGMSYDMPNNGQTAFNFDFGPIGVPPAQMNSFPQSAAPDRQSSFHFQAQNWNPEDLAWQGNTALDANIDLSQRASVDSGGAVDPVNLCAGSSHIIPQDGLQGRQVASTATLLPDILPCTNETSTGAATTGIDPSLRKGEQATSVTHEGTASTAVEDITATKPQKRKAAIRSSRRTTSKAKGRNARRQVEKRLVTADGQLASTLPRETIRAALGLQFAHAEVQCVFPGCAETLVAANISQHFKAHFEGDKDCKEVGYVCPLGCGKPLGDVAGLKKHVRDKHMNAFRLNCAACGGSFSRQSWDQVMRHLEAQKHAKVWEELGLHLEVVAIPKDKDADNTKAEEDDEDGEGEDDEEADTSEFVEGSSKGVKRRRI